MRKRFPSLFLVRNWLTILLPSLLLIFLYVVLYKIYMPRVNAFGCFDDCFNFMGGYFLLKGKHLYSEIFFNHQPLMAYVSAFLQLFLKPQSIYELVLEHRKALLLFSLCFNLLLIIRFRLVGFGFAIFYEFSKFYLFGDRFLAEGFIVYPLVYMVGIVWHKLQKQKIYSFDYILSAIFAWFVVFMREPYVPLALLLFTFLLIGGQRKVVKIISTILLLILSFFTMSLFSLPDYFFNVVTVSKNSAYATELASNNTFGIGLFSIFFYPFTIFFGGNWNLFRHFEIGLAIVWIVLVGALISQKKYKDSLFLFLILGFANLRMTIPGKIFYEGFHMLSWYAILIFTIFLILNAIYKKKQIIFYCCFSILILLFIYLVFSPKSYIYDKIDPHVEHLTNYGNELQVGQVVKILSKPSDTLFVDGFDDLIIWQANRTSNYPYSWYTGLMLGFPIYNDARFTMFKKNLPDFYYGTCPNDLAGTHTMPKFAKKAYQQLYSFGKPTCLYVKKSKLRGISQKQWDDTKLFNYELPPTEKKDNSGKNNIIN